MSTTDQQPQQKKAKIKSDHFENDPRFNCRFTLSRELGSLVLEIQDELGKVLVRKPSIPMTLRYMVLQIANLRERTGSLKALMGLDSPRIETGNAQARKFIPGFPTYV